MNSFLTLSLVAIGGALGSVGRYWVSALTMRWASLYNAGGFPWGTLLVNILGCALIGILAVVIERLSSFNAELRLLLITGVLGGFTTFSSFGLDTWYLMRKGEWLYATAYVTASVGFGILMVALTFAYISRTH
jgi:CrcB protein